MATHIPILSLITDLYIGTNLIRTRQSSHLSGNTGVTTRYRQVVTRRRTAPHLVACAFVELGRESRNFRVLEAQKLRTNWHQRQTTSLTISPKNSLELIASMTCL